MREIFQQALVKYNEYQGAGAQMTLFWMSILLLYIGKGNQKNNLISAMIRYSLLFMVVFFCPISAGIIMKYCIGYDVYWRMVWLLPEVVVLAYIFTKLIMECSGIKKVLVALGCVLLIAFNSVCFLDYTNFSLKYNWENIPQQTIEVASFLKQNQAELGEEEVRVIVTDEFICSLRQHDATIKMPYGRAVLKGEKTHPIHDTLMQTPLQCDTLAYLAEEYGCNYLVYPISEDGNVEKHLDQAGFRMVGQVEQYNIYHLEENKKGDWQIISYPEANGQQGIFYTLYNKNENKLVLIDGGWDADDNQTRDIIRKYGGKVDAWFVTHYHADHATAFEQVYADPQGIEIEKVYAPEYDYEYFKSVAYEWDDFETYEKFLEVTENAKNLEYLKRDDKVVIAGLTFDIYNTYDDLSVETSDDIGNEGGLLMKISGENKSLLFCADVHSSQMADLLIERYGENLKADYVQLGHHGNNSFPTYFYDVVNPKVAIFDAPEWLMIGEEFTAKDLKNYFVLKGVETWDYSTGRHVFYLD